MENLPHVNWLTTYWEQIDKCISGGKYRTPLLNLKIKKKSFVVIEASSFQLSHSKFVKPDYAILLNISNDHLDWHGNKNNYLKAQN